MFVNTQDVDWANVLLPIDGVADRCVMLITGLVYTHHPTSQWHLKTICCEKEI